MKIDKIRLHNFRCFSELEMQFDSMLTVLVGDNGAGKTAVLEGLAVCLGRILTELPKLKGTSLRESDIRVAQAEGRYVKAGPALVEIWTNDGIHWRRSLGKWLKGKSYSMRVSRDVSFKEYMQTLRNAIAQGGNVSIPLFVYYGNSRSVLVLPKRRRAFKKEFERLEALQQALEPNTRFKPFFEWFYKVEYEEMKIARDSPGYVHPGLQAVRTVMERCFPGFRNPRIEVRPLRFMLDNPSGLPLHFEQLSDGYRTMLALVMDLARRMVLANPHLEQPLETEALVLIDEVDLHLHPRWQQSVLNDLTRAFPNAQFIVTTHSPQVLTTVPWDKIRIIRDGEVHAAPPGTEGAEASRLLKRVLGVEVRPRGLEATKELHEYLALVDDDAWDSPRAVELRQRLDQRYKGEEPALLEADLRIENRKWELGDEARP